VHRGPTLVATFSDCKAGALAPTSMDEGEMTRSAASATRFDPHHVLALAFG
jgi:hypothetical protein